MEASFAPTLEMDFPAESLVLRRQLWEEFNELRGGVSCLCRENQELKHEIGQLQAEVTRLQRANLELRQQVGYWQSRHRDALTRIGELEQTIEQLQAEKRQLQNDLFGRQTEKQGPDRSNDLADLDDLQEDQPKRKRGQQSDKPGPKRRDYSHLETREEFVDLPPAECVCNECGKPLLVLSDTEDSEVIEIEVRAHRRLIRRRRYRRTCTCGGNRTMTAPAAAKLIPKGRLGVSVWVEILLDKYLTYRPTERLLVSWQLLGLDLAPGTVADGLQRLEPLLAPIYEALKVQNQQQGNLYQADETRWLVFVAQEGKDNYCWWLWVFANAQTVVYVLDPSRSHAVPQNHLPQDRRVVLLVDRLSSYKAMEQTKLGLVLLAFCWAHVRRDFIRVAKGWTPLKPWALQWLRHIRHLYRLNDQRLEVLPNPLAFAQADAALRQAVTEMQTQTATELADPQLHPACRKTLVSLQEHWEGLTRFVDDPRIPMDNNGSERRLRGPAVARKNFYGSAALWSGRLAAMLFSIFATLKLWKINPRHWLTWYLQSCANAGGKAPETIEPFLPWNLSKQQRQTLMDQAPENDDSS